LSNKIEYKLHKRNISVVYKEIIMKFCDICDNMYYVSINEKNQNELSYYCRNCGNVDDNVTGENTCVLNTQIKKGEQKYNHIINEYTKYDPTLPRLYNMECPNATCKTHSDKTVKSDILYIRYDEENMKYLYMCSICDIVWKTDETN
jgi:DNA-directed RNA polymerase subunit M/transcription elongation factor TFIIS